MNDQYDRPASTWTAQEIENYRQLWLETEAECVMLDQARDMARNLKFYVDDLGHLIIERVGEPPDFYRIDGTEEVEYDFRPYREQGLRFQEGFNVGDRIDKGEYPLR